MKELPAVKWDERQKIADECLPDLGSRQNFLVFVEGVANAVKTRDLLEQLHLEWQDFAQLYKKDDKLSALYRLSKERGDEYRQVLREDEADRRAVEGVTEDIYHKGKVVGKKKVFSDHMLALQLKAGNPDKYSDKQQMEMKGVMLNLEIQGVDRAPKTEE